MRQSIVRGGVLAALLAAGPAFAAKDHGTIDTGESREWSPTASCPSRAFRSRSLQLERCAGRRRSP